MAVAIFVSITIHNNKRN